MCLDESRKNALVCHHGPYSEWDDDGASIREAYKLRELEALKYLVHGHVHGGRTGEVFGLFKIGVGSAYLSERDLSSQFLAIESNEGEFVEAISYYYAKDLDGYSEKVIELPFNQKIDIGMDFCVNEVQEVQYDRPMNYFSRRFHHLTSKDADDSSVIESKELYKFCRKYRKIILLGEAGSGKTYEVNHLVSFLQDESVLFEPIIMRLNLYSGESIGELVTEINGEIPPRLFLILDGYDEIDPLQVKRFKRKLYVFMKAYSNVIVLLTCRSNFYRNKVNDEIDGTLEGFEELLLKHLENVEVQQYLESSGVSKKDVYKIFDDKSLLSLIQNPFFLTYFVRAFVLEPKDYKQVTILEHMISKTESFDQIKYSEIPSAQESFEEAKPILQKVAFSLQCLGKNYLTDEEYRQLVKYSNREIIKFVGYWNQSESLWRFTHNNFKEYLAANYLNKFPVEEAIKVITYEDNRERLNQSWNNVLSFVLALENPFLKDWVIKNEPQIIIKFDSSRIGEENKTQIIMNVLENLKERNMWIGQERNSPSELIVFCQTEEAVRYILSEIANPLHFRALYNAISVIHDISNTFGMDEEIKACLLNVCKRRRVRGHEKGASIRALCERGYADIGIEKELVALFMEETDRDIRYRMYQYLTRFEAVDRNIDFFIKGIDFSKEEREGITNASEEYWLKQGLMKVKSVEAIQKMLSYFMNIKDWYRAPLSNEVFAHIIQQACQITIVGEFDFYDNVKDLYIQNALAYYNKFDSEFEDFFVLTNTTLRLYEFILYNYERNDKYFVLKRVMNKSSPKKCVLSLGYSIRQQP
jgi:hypothetical protein